MIGNVKLAGAVGAVVMAGAVLPGCVVKERTTVYEEHPRRVVVTDPYGPRPVYVTPTPYAPPTPYVAPTPGYPAQSSVVITRVPPPEPAVVVIRRPPPAVISERPGIRPGPRHVWVPGYWAAQRGEWVWVRGQWAVPPREGAVWVAPRYEPHGTEFNFSLGFWK